MGLARQVDTAEFEEAIQDCSTPILLDVFATWCGPCQFMAPALEEVAQKLEGKVRVLKIDSDAEPDVSNTLQIRGLPTILLINDMSVIMRVEGALRPTSSCSSSTTTSSAARRRSSARTSRASAPRSDRRARKM